MALPGGRVSFNELCMWVFDGDLDKVCAGCGTAMAHGAVCLRACYAMSGTDIAYGSAYEPAMRCPVLSQRMVLPEHSAAVQQRCRRAESEGSRERWYRPTRVLRNVRY
eukprot:623336-Rhodomonas_salina.2